jgi:hypothetical protein
MSIWNSLSRGIGRRFGGRGVGEEFNNLSSEQLATIMMKAFAFPQVGNSGYIWEDPPVREVHPWDDPESVRRAIHAMSNYYNVLGVYRADFDKAANDTLFSNSYVALPEKRILDTLASLDVEVVDKRNEPVEDAMDFLRYPNPQDTLSDVIKASCSDLLRYDAGTIVKSFNRKKTIQELKAYPGTEFWAEIDRVPFAVDMGPKDWLNDQNRMIGLWSHGYIQRYWQRSRPGVYISFEPEEIAYLRMYRRSDNVYGTAFVERMKYQIQYLIDSTRAAGKTFSNGIVPSIVWNHPQVMDMKSLIQRIEEVKQNNQGSYNFGRMLHTVGEEKIETLSHTLHDMEWLEGQRFVAGIVWAMFGFKPQDFMDSDNNRATAYISATGTKSAMLYPLIKYYEDMFDRDILPYMDGYQKDWRFKFIKDVDNDDELKKAEIRSAQANTFSMLMGTGMDPQWALKFAGMVDDVQTLDIEFTMPSVPMTGGGDQGSATSHKGPGEKKFVSTTATRRSETSPNQNYKIDFGNNEERQAGIQKGARMITLRKENVEINIVPQSPSIWTKRNHESIDLGYQLKKLVMKRTGHSREQMQRHATWNKLLPKFIEEHGLTRTDSEYGVGNS